MKKIMHICFAFVLVMSAILLTTGIGVPKVAAEGINGLVGDIEVSYFAPKANPGDADIPQTSITDETTRIKMNYNFKFDNTGSEGQISEFKLPTNVFKMPDPATDQPFEKDPTLGTFTNKADGTVILKFNPNKTGVDAWFEFETWINPDYEFSSNKEVIKLENNHTLTLDAAFSKINEKKGTYDQANSKITWTIDVNTDMKDLSSLRVQDTIPQYLALVPASIKVNQLKVSESGKKTTGNAVSGVSNTGGQNLDLTLQNLKGAYRITFDTTISGDAPTMTFKNEATLNGSEKLSAEVPYTSEIVISKEVAAPTTTKLGANPPTDATTVNPDNEITWEVIINDASPRKNISPGLELRDIVTRKPKGSNAEDGQSGWNMRLVNSLQIEKKEQGSNTWVPANGDFAFVTTPTTGLTVPGTEASELNSIIRYMGTTTTTAAYRFIYKTQDSAMKEYYGDKDNKVYNRAQLYFGTGTNATQASKEVQTSYSYSRSGNRTFTKRFIDIDYQNQMITTQFVVRVPDSTKQISIFDYADGHFNLAATPAENISIKRYAFETSITFELVGNGGGFYKPVDDNATFTTLDATQYHVKNVFYNGNIVPNQMNYYLFEEGSTAKTPSGLYIIEIKSPYNADATNENNEYLYNNALVREDNKDASRYVSAYHWFTNNPFMINNGFKNGNYDLEKREIT